EPRVSARVAPDRDEEVRRPVHDLRVLDEVCGRVDDAEDPDEALHAVERPDLARDRDEHAEARQAGRLVARRGVEIAAELPHDQGAVGAERNVPREEEEIPRPYGVYVGPGLRWRGRERQPELPKTHGGGVLHAPYLHREPA